MRLGRFALLFGFALLTVIQGYSQDPTFEWVARAGGAAAFSGGYGIARDAAGNVYVGGRFTGTVDFDPGAGTTNLTSAGALDVYVTKTDAVGNLVWAKRVGGTLDDYSLDMSADEGGSVYVTGAFSGTADFDPGPGTFNLSSAGLFDDIFVLKLDANGDLAWAKKMGGADFDFGRSITVSSAGNVFTTGNFRGTVDFDPGSGTSFLTSTSGGNDIFISKLDASGNFVWARRMGGTSSDIGYAITVDAAENVFTTGSFSTTADFDPGAVVFNLVDAGNGDIFISKLDVSGNFVWAKRIGGTSSDVGYDIQLDFSGDVYTTGYFEATADFDPGAGTANLVSAGFNDSFISKLDPSGNYIWAKGMGGISDEESNSLALDGFGNVYTTGSFESTVDFDPGAGTFPITPVGSADAFVVKLNTSGDFVWAEAMLGAGSTFPNGIDVDNFGSVYTTGYFNGTVDFDPGPGVSNATAVGSNDTYIHKMSQDLPPPTIASFAPSSGPVGTTVILTGSNFSPTLLANTVYFGATRATVTDATPTQLTVTVPVGATYQHISVTVAGTTGFSSKPFLVTFADGGVIGACAFDAKVDFTTGVNPKSVAIGDVDGDGKADLVVANFNSNTISVFRNIGVAGSVTAGSLGTKVDFASGTQPIHVIMGDLDGDGKLDIAVTNFGGGTISVFRNTSVSGTINASSFAAKVDFTTGAQPQSIAIADLDSDGKLDMINSNFSGSNFSAHRNTSTPGLINASSFEAQVTFSTGGGPTGNLLSDLDGDGKVDVVTVNQTGNTVSVFRNTSTVGSFSVSTFATPVAFTTGASPISIAAGDLDGDNKAELVVANTGSNTVSVFRNTTTSGAITIGSFAAKVDFTTGSSPISVSIDDIDGEGSPDIAVANSASSNISVLRNEMTGPISTTSFAAKVDFVTGSTPWARIGDLDGDGKPDLAVTGGGSVSVLRNTVSSLAPPTITNISPTNGPVGTTVTITGTNFSAASLLNNTVKFNGVTATVLAATSTSITSVVPVGATTGTISVTVGCSTATSLGTFNVYCVPSAERDALIELYNATDGANWSDNTGWLSADVSTWYGVTVTGCNVTGLSLDGNNLVGIIPYQIGDLTQLEFLELGANQLSGSIPPEIGNLSALTALNLSINQLDGSVPLELSYLSNLQVLGLSFNSLNGNLPSDLMFLNNLTDVFLNNNMFSGDLPLIGGTTANLNTLLAQFNQFADIPDLNSYSSLGFVNVASNRLTFDDLEPYMGLSNFFYDPQAQVPPGGIISFIPGGTLNIPFSTGGTANSYQWYKDNVAIPGATASSLSIPGATAADVGFYKVRITSAIVPLLVLESMSYTVITDPCASSTPTSGDLDASFAPLIDVPSYYSQPAQQTSGKILVGTDYTSINSSITSGILRFNTDGSLDNTFASNSYGPYFIRLPDDRILAATNGNLELLDANGNLDASFNNPSYYNATIYALALQSDGKILVSVNEDGNLHLDRLNADGTLDASFSAPLGIEVISIRVQTDDHIVIGGYFVGGIMRLDPTGAVDPTFNATASDFVTDVAIQSDGKILVVGYFNYMNDIPRRGVARLESDGSLDNTFVALGITDPFESGYYFTRIAIQPNNRIILAGLFETINGASRKNLVRLNPDGTVDCPFDPELSTDDVIGGLALQADEKILISGSFTDYDGTQRFGLARVNNITGSTITIILQPSDATVCEGGIATFATEATGTTSITYQWQKQNDQAASLQGLRWSIPAISSGGADVDNVVDPPDVSATMGGALGTTYAVTLRFRGVAEAKTYVGGTTAGFWNAGGTPSVDGYNVYQLDISDPPGTYYLNAGTSGITYTYLLDYVQTVNIKAGATVVLKAIASDNLQIKNRDNLGNPIVVPGIPPSPSPFNGQFIQMDVVAIDGGLFSDLSDGGGYSGTGTSTLNVNTSGAFGAGRYRCRINGDAAPEVTTNDKGLFINALPTAPVTTGGASCGSGSVTLLSSGAIDGNYRWYTLASGGTAITGEVNSTYITPIITSTTTYYVAINNGTCESATRTSVDAIINIPPTAPTTSGAANCAASVLTLTASGGVNGQYRWYTAATGGTALVGEVNDTYTTPVLTTTTTYHVAIDDGTCESARTPVTASINTVAKPVLVTSNCTALGALLAGPSGFASYAWSNGETTQVIAVTSPGSYTLVVTASTGCASPPSDPTVFIPFFCNQAPTISPASVTTTVEGTVTINLTTLTSDLDNNIDLSTLQVVVAPASGANAFFNSNAELVVDYTGIAFAGTDQLTVRVCDVAGACGQEIITIEVAGEITVYNALSPNGDGKNDTFIIQYIEALPETQKNKVTIFNRWGTVVFEVADYNNSSNVFKGLSNSGGELPSGTYYYTIEFTNGEAKRTGFLSLRR